MIKNFSRYEFKYLISKTTSNKIESEIKFFMKKDDYSDNNNTYFVRSLYFDNKNNAHFYEKADGMRSRSKFRLRTYSNMLNLSNDKLLFLEEKGRLKQRTFKNRIKIDFEDCEYFINLEKTDYLLKKYNNELVRKYVFNYYRKFLGPTVLVDYYRKPYINIAGLYFRLTFDSEIKSCKSDSIVGNNQISSWSDCKSGFVILELKFERSIPLWFHRIIQSYNLKRVSISKFVVGTEVNRIATDPSA